MNKKQRGLELLVRYLKFNDEEKEILDENIINMTYTRVRGFLQFTIFIKGMVIFLKQVADSYVIRITGNGNIKECTFSLTESIRGVLLDVITNEG